jgi:hypothetical protein
MFASRTLTEHLIRGGAAAAMIAVALSDVPWWCVIPAVCLAIVLLRGCPMCWLAGLVMTIAARLGAEPPSITCPRPVRPPPRSASIPTAKGLP